MRTAMSDPDDDLRDEVRLLREEVAMLREAVTTINRFRMGADFERRERYGL